MKLADSFRFTGDAVPNEIVVNTYFMKQINSLRLVSVRLLVFHFGSMVPKEKSRKCHFTLLKHILGETCHLDV